MQNRDSRRRRRREYQNIFREIMVENFPNLKEYRYPGIRIRVSQTRWKDPHQNILIEVEKLGEIILKAARGKQRVSYKEPS